MSAQRAGTRRGFTLLEVMLAAALGVVLAGVVMGLIFVLNSADATLARRYEQQQSLTRTQRVVRDAVGSLVMAPTPTPSGRPTEEQNDGLSAAERNRRRREERRQGPARFILEVDESTELANEARAAGLAGVRAQRLEMVITRPPPPPAAWSDAARRRRATAEPTEGRGGGPVRGAFELRPSPPPEGAGSGWGAEADVRVRGWDLWWRPLPPDLREEEEKRVDRRALEARRRSAGEPTLIASGLKTLRWDVFAEREWLGAYRAVHRADLPAYVRMTVETTSGMRHEWLFEVMWADGAEVEAAQGEDIEEETPAGGAGGAGGADGGGAGGDGSRSGRGRDRSGGAAEGVKGAGGGG